jgi:CO/xanthine dehydrogenase FAD-binding subunit
MAPIVHVPESVPDAVAALQQGAAVLGGGTALMPRLNTSAHDVEALVSLRRTGLDRIEVAEGVATIGAATTLARLGRDGRLAFLHDALETIASPTIRNMATVAGNLFVPQPYGDLAVCLLALDAIAHVAGAERPVADILRDGVGPGEVVSAVSFELPAAGEWFYTKAMRRRLNSASIVTVAAVVTTGAGGAVETARIALGGAGARPVRAPSAEAALAGGPLDRARVEAAAAAALDDAEPFGDAYASAWYRRRVLPVHVRRALLGE